MSFTAGTNVRGIRETVRELKKMSPTLQQEFRDEAARIAAPIVDKARSEYPQEYLSGMRRNWRYKGSTGRATPRRLFPYSQARARNGVKVSASTKGSSKTVIKIVQTNPAASVVDVAGSENATAKGRLFAANLTAKSGKRPSRVMWPAAESELPRTRAEIVLLLRRIEAQINRRLA